MMVGANDEWSLSQEIRAEGLASEAGASSLLPARSVADEPVASQFQRRGV
jgi:hypothetical protein